MLSISPVTLRAILIAIFILPACSVTAQTLDRETTLWEPYVEWSVENPAYAGNPFDLIATATFSHTDSGATHTTSLFYDGDTIWRFRFTGTRLGEWSFTTSSTDPDLDGIAGSVVVTPNPDPTVRGFVTHAADKWARPIDETGRLEAFIPQFVMADTPDAYYQNGNAVQSDIETFHDQHGFNGFHIFVGCRWADLEQVQCDDVSDRNPDLRTFEALELLITRLHKEGGVVHLWAWGDAQRRMTPKNWGGLNGVDDDRIQRYIAARLGPLPGWTMGYGFDIWEWASESDLEAWHSNMHAQFGWPHMLGARATKNTLEQLYEGFDYSGYEQHKPDYNKYVETIRARPTKPSFSEDRFRVRPGSGRSKDYSFEEIRRGLWHSAMAGGVANIWGYLPDGGEKSAPFPNPEWIKTNAVFFGNFFAEDLYPCPELTDGLCLRNNDGSRFIFYKESASALEMDLSSMPKGQTAIAVDTKSPYAEANLGILEPGPTQWESPYESDWAITVGVGPVSERRNRPNPPTDLLAE